VPFRVYGFTSNMSRYDYETYENKKQELNEMNTAGFTGGCHPMGVHLLELFSDKMSRAQMTFMSKAILVNYLPNSDHRVKREFAYKHGLVYRNVNWLYQDSIFQLGGTPLNHALVVGMPLAQDFRAAHRIDVLNTILLTDGSSHDLEDVNCDSWSFRYGSDRKLITYTCPLNNKTYKLKNYTARNGIQTDALLAMYKDITGSSIIGYRIESQRTRDLANCYGFLKGHRLGWDVEAELGKEYRKEGWIKVDNAIGYDECFILNAKSLGIEDNKMESLDSDASKAKIRGAFKKAQGNTKKTRRMLTDLCERVA